VRPNLDFQGLLAATLIEFAVPASAKIGERGAAEQVSVVNIM
jgi:hypothetical protein